MLDLLFFVSIALLFYIYLGYPLLLQLLASSSSTASPLTNIIEPPSNKPGTGETDYPSISILIAAFNEEDCIAETLRNKLSLDYPHDKFEILVISDASDDATDALVQQVAKESTISVQLIRQQQRQGKTAGLNRLVEQAKGELLVFSDANSIYHRSALIALSECFNAADVGYVTGKMIYTQDDGSVVGDGCSQYMHYENWLRQQETQVASVVGVDGGIDAMRRALYSKLEADQLPDFVQPLKVIEQGYRVIYTPNALLYEKALVKSEQEFAMRVRVSLRALWALHDMQHLLNPLQYGLFAVQLCSHKLLRYLAFIPLAIALLSNLWLWPDSDFYKLTLVMQLLFYTFAYSGYKQRYKAKLPSFSGIPYYFILLNISAALACYKFLQHEKMVTWTPRQG